MLIDYRQAQQYNPLRIIAHETGHALGLPDHYSGPCSELMSGGGPGPSCTNAYPNATERSRVNTIWRYGIAAYDASAAFTPATPPPEPADPTNPSPPRAHHPFPMPSPTGRGWDGPTKRWGGTPKERVKASLRAARRRVPPAAPGRLEQPLTRFWC